jgi:hypothetical protein
MSIAARTPRSDRLSLNHSRTHEMPTPKHAAEGPRVPPPRYKMALLTWPGAWALITLILWGLGPVMATWPLPLRTLVVSVMMVVGLTWLVIPYLTRTFAAWLAATHPDRGAGGLPVSDEVARTRDRRRSRSAFERPQCQF